MTEIRKSRRGLPRRSVTSSGAIAESSLLLVMGLPKTKTTIVSGGPSENRLKRGGLVKGGAGHAIDYPEGARNARFFR